MSILIHKKTYPADFTVGERHLYGLYRDILKYGYYVIKVDQDEDDYLVYLEKEMGYEDGAEFTMKVCWRLKAQ